MSEIKSEVIDTMILEVINMERKNLRSQAKTDSAMSEEIQKVIIEYSKAYARRAENNEI